MVTGFGAPRSRSGRRTRLGLVALSMAASAAALAQAPGATMPLVAPSPVFAIKGFKVAGENPLGEAETARVLMPFVRSDANMETLQKATAALETALRERGFGLHRVALPPQDVGDTVTLNIVKFNVARIHIEGRSIYDEANVRRALPELREGESPNFKRLAIQTAIANENPNKQVEVGLRESDEPDKIDATITVKELRPWTLALGLSNAGSTSTGRDRATVSGGHTNLFNLDHQFIGAYTTSVERTEDVKQLGMLYKVPLYSSGGVIGASYTRSDVVGNFGTFNSTGAGHTFGLSYTLYLPPQRGRRSYVSLGLDDKVFDAAVINDIVIPGGMDRRSRPVTLGYTARVDSDTASWGYNIDLAANTGSGRNNDLVSYQNEDSRISTVHWKAVRGGLSYSAPFAQNWIWSVRGQYQYSPDVLISGEQFGLGGLGSVRGTDIDRPVTADKGLSATFEVSTPELMPGLRLLGFLDAGWLGNNSPNGTTKPSSDRLASVGLGLRYGGGPFAVSLEYGRLVTGSSVPLAFNSAAPQQGDDRVYLSLSVRF
jgi:hemolysin activation/secretion protein